MAIVVGKGSPLWWKIILVLLRFRQERRDGARLNDCHGDRVEGTDCGITGIRCCDLKGVLVPGSQI